MMGRDPDVLQRWGLVPGGQAIFEQAGLPVSVWGRGDQVLWASGEALIVGGPAGVGKSTLAQNLVLARCGLPGFSEVLGYPVVESRGPVIYLAMDRPRQILRSMQRMLSAEDRERLNDRLLIRAGPLPATVDRSPGDVLRLCEEVAAGTIVIDSLKDATSADSDELVAAAYNAVRQQLLASGVEVIEVHHTRKLSQQARERRHTPSLEDLSGSYKIGAGAGSAVLLDGKIGTDERQLVHAKVPLEQVGPLAIRQDRATGRVSLSDPQSKDQSEKVLNLVDELDRLNVPLDAGRPTCARALKEANLTYSGSALAEAVRERKASTAGPVLDGLVQAPLDHLHQALNGQVNTGGGETP